MASTAWTEAAIDKLPGGLAGYDTNAGASAQTATDDYGTVTFTSLDDRFYMVEISTGITVNTNSAVILVSIANASNAALVATTLDYAAGENGAVRLRYLATGDGTSKTFKCRVQRSSGTGTYSIGEVLVTVLDVGPAF